jgi:hypothetical protein
MIHLRNGYRAWCAKEFRPITIPSNEVGKVLDGYKERFPTMTDDLETANCSECLALEEASRKEQALKPHEPSRLERWAMMGIKAFAKNVLKK